MNSSQVVLVIIHFLMLSGGFLPATMLADKRYDLYVVIPYISIYLIAAFLYFKASSPPGFVDQSNTPLEPTADNWFCEKCQQYVPLRASHCDVCGKCVLRRDHHCPWLGACVGMDNHLFFILLLGYMVFFYIFQIFVFKGALKDGIPFDKWLITSLPCTIFLCFSIISLLQPAFLLPFHIYLALSNRTTWEILRGSKISYFAGWQSAISPFSQGLLGNIADFATMRWKQPIYSVPRDEESLEQWKDANSCLDNDMYSC